MSLPGASSSPEKDNFVRLCTLLVDEGTALLREIFDAIHPPATLQAFLSKPETTTKLTKAQLYKQEEEKVYPSGGGTATSQDFDITLLCKLLKNVCNLTPPTSKWKTFPKPEHKGQADDLVRIRFYRNDVTAHAKEMKTDNSEFERLWREISSAMIRLANHMSSDRGNAWTTRIAQCRSRALTFKEEQYVQEVLDWEKQDKEVKEIVTKSLECNERVEASVMNLGQQVKTMMDIVTKEKDPSSTPTIEESQTTDEVQIKCIKYCKKDLLGVGSQGRVYEGTFSGRRVAVKRMYKGPDEGNYVKDEAEKLKKLDHPNVVRCFEVEEEKEFVYLALEFCEKKLTDCVKQNDFHRKDSGLDGLTCLREITGAVAYLHERNICHRDINPDNILLSCSEQPRFVLADCNIAKNVHSASTVVGNPPGTLGYIAPELYEVEARITTKGDLFSLGCVLFYVISNGRHLFGPVKDLKKCQTNIRSANQPPSLEDDDFSQETIWTKSLIARMLSYDPVQRPNATDVLEELEKPVQTADPLISRSSIGNTEALLIPAEIIASGAKAEEAYRKVLKGGMVQVYRARIMLVGQDRAGKTSLKKSLLGMPFDPEQPSTVGIEVDPSRMEVEVDQVKKWQRLDEKKSGLSAEYADKIAKDMAKVLKKELGKKDEPSPSDFAGPGIELIQISRNNKDNEDEDEEAPAETGRLRTDQAMNVGEVFPSDKSIKVIQSARQVDDKRPVKETTEELKQLRVDTSLGEDVRSPLIQYLKNLHVEKDTKDKETVLSIWDFAGQQLYYASHSVFLSPRAIYVLVYDLSKDLNAKAEPCARQGAHKIRLENPNDETNLDNLLSWLVSIHSSRPVDSEGRSEETREYVRPPVLIVGTHANKTSINEQKETETCIKESISGKSTPLGGHVIRPFFKVDNTDSCKDEGVMKLQREICKILTLEPTGEWVPTKWFHFEKVIQALIGKGRHHLSVEELAEIAREVCFIDNAKEVNKMIEYYHSIGEIMKHEGIVVLQTRWLIDMFRKLITVSPFDEQIPKYTGCWNDLKENGILRMELVDHVLGEKSTEDVQKKDLLNMMEKFGLLAKFVEMKETDTGHRSEGNRKVHYFIPSQLKSSPKELVNVEPEEGDPCPIYLCFEDEFVPHGFFPQIVSRLICWCSDLGFGPPLPKLYQCSSRFFGVGKPNSPHDLILIAKKQYIKVVLRRDEGCDTGSNVAADVRHFLENTLADLRRERASLRCMSHQWCVRCPPCLAKSGDVHLLPVKPNKKLHCTETFDKKPISLDGLAFWFPRNQFLRVHSVQDYSSGFTARDEDVRSLIVLDNLAREICLCWESLGRHLHLDQAEIDSITANNNEFPSSRKKAFQMLKVWYNRESSSTYAELSNALRSINEVHLAENYCPQQIPPGDSGPHVEER